MQRKFPLLDAAHSYNVILQNSGARLKRLCNLLACASRKPGINNCFVVPQLLPFCCSLPLCCSMSFQPSGSGEFQAACRGGRGLRIKRPPVKMTGCWPQGACRHEFKTSNSSLNEACTLSQPNHNIHLLWLTKSRPQMRP
eukprot:scaffold53005_cov21-Tisochrysis_lutea.AAC.1